MSRANDIDVNPLQALVDSLSVQWQKQRAESQMTLGTLIFFLEETAKATVVRGLGNLISYRGYYRDLAFEPTNETKTVRELLDECRAAMGRTFEGYKGGDFLMGETTPLWVSAYGEDSGMRLVGFSVKNGILYPNTEIEKQEDIS